MTVVLSPSIDVNRGRLRKLVILDRIMLLEAQWDALRELADEIVEYAGLDPKEIQARLQAETASADGPMCWTQLAQEEMTVAEINDRIDDADGVITCWTNIPDQVLIANPQLRYIGFWTNVVEHRINIDLARSRGIEVTYIPDYGTDSVAEMTFAGLLAVQRNLIRAARDTQRGSWGYELLKTGKRVPPVDSIPEQELRGKRLGLVGFGRIGQRVAEIASAFHMEVAYWSRQPRLEWHDRGVRMLSLDDLFRWSDILSVHLSPYAAAGIVSRERLAMLQDGAIFLNTSVGRVVDQDALWTELRSRRLRAFIDVYEGLPPRKMIRELSGMGNVFTYRAGWFTRQAIEQKGQTLVSDLGEFVRA